MNIKLRLCFVPVVFLMSCREGPESSSRSGEKSPPQPFEAKAEQGAARDEVPSRGKAPPQNHKVSDKKAQGEEGVVEKASPSPVTDQKLTESSTATPQKEDVSSMRLAVERGMKTPSRSNLNADQKGKIQAMLDGVCDQAQAGQPVDVAALTQKILSFKLGQGFDPAALGGLGAQGDLSQAIKDLVAAAMNADVDGILKAVQDIVGAV